MTRRIVAAATLTALVNLMLAGCTKNVNLELREVGQLTSRQIVGAGLKAGEEISFNQLGGQYNAATKQITGITPSGERVMFRLSELTHVTIELQNAALNDAPTRIQVEATEFASYFRNDKPLLCRSATSKQGTFYRFARPGGSFDLTARTVTGYEDGGGPITIPLDEIAYVTVSKQKTLATLLLVWVGANTFCLVVCPDVYKWKD